MSEVPVGSVRSEALVDESAREARGGRSVVGTGAEDDAGVHEGSGNGKFNGSRFGTRVTPFDTARHSVPRFRRDDEASESSPMDRSGRRNPAFSLETGASTLNCRFVTLVFPWEHFAAKLGTHSCRVLAVQEFPFRINDFQPTCLRTPSWHCAHCTTE